MYYLKRRLNDFLHYILFQNINHLVYFFKNYHVVKQCPFKILYFIVYNTFKEYYLNIYCDIYSLTTLYAQIVETF